MAEAVNAKVSKVILQIGQTRNAVRTHRKFFNLARLLGFGCFLVTASLQFLLPIPVGELIHFYVLEQRKDVNMMDASSVMYNIRVRLFKSSQTFLKISYDSFIVISPLV